MANHILGFLVCVTMVTMVTSSEPCEYCFPGDDTCFPPDKDGALWSTSLKGEVIQPTDVRYGNLTYMSNTRVTKYPRAIVMAETVQDIIKTVNFANKYNIKLSIRSSGHDYIGRSTGDGTLQINLSLMKALSFNLNSTRHPAGELRAETGNQWIRVYEETNKVGRVIVGGSAHTVSMGGYTLGGGHAPICRKFGLAVDNLLEIEMVTANGSLVRADAYSTKFIDPDFGSVLYESSDTDLFWAVRGGGGGTFGIVTAFTYKLHHDSEMVTINCYSPIVDTNGVDHGRAFWKVIDNLAATTLAPEWGGYQISSREDSQGNNGSILLVLNHFGPWGSDSFKTIQPLLDYAGPYCYSQKNVSSFWEYEKNTNDPLYYEQYIFNTFLQPDSFTDDYYDFLENFIVGKHDVDVFAGCTGALIGGNMMNVGADDTAVTPSFRTGVWSMSCGVTPGEDRGSNPLAWVEFGEQMSVELLKFGNGTYYNEPSQYLPNWKTDYWGGHYDRLLQIKQAWDPDRLFTCLHCVGSELKRRTHPMPSDDHSSGPNGGIIVG